MAHEWILDVLADLKTYAGRNGLPALVEQLDDSMLLAATEIASSEGKPRKAATQNAGTTGYVY